MNRKHLLTSAVGALVATAIAGGVAYATIPDAKGTINGCYRLSEDDQKGQLRVVNDPTACRPNEAPIVWNQVGPQGAKGEPGTPGTNGTNGADGEDGVSVTTAAEPVGANCAGGGVQLTAVSGVSYVCNGKAGADGTDGTDGTNGADGEDGVSVTSTAEPAGSNCANGGSKFTAANGVTYACNGRDGSGSTNPVISSRAGGATLDPQYSVTLADTAQLTAVASCITGYGFVLGVYGPNDSAPPPARAALWEGAQPKYLPNGGYAGGSVMLADSSHPESSFSGIVLKADGMSFEARGNATYAPSGCSIVYHATVSQG